MTRQEKINYIADYFNECFKWKKLLYGWEIDRAKIEALSDKELDNFITYNCRY